MDFLYRRIADAWSNYLKTPRSRAKGRFTNYRMPVQFLILRPPKGARVRTTFSRDGSLGRPRMRPVRADDGFASEHASQIWFADAY